MFQQAIENLSKQMIELQNKKKIIQIIEEYISDTDFPIYISTGTSIDVIIPLDKEILKIFRQKLGKDFYLTQKWKDYNFNDGTIHRYSFYKHKESGHRFMVTLNPQMEGSTCQVVQDGFEQVPKTKIVCN